MKSVENPLTEQHRRDIEESLRVLGQLPTLFEKCDKCGIDVSALRGDAEFLTESLTKIKTEFFGNQSYKGEAGYGG